MKEWLIKLIKGYDTQLADLRSRNDAATTADEVREIGKQIENIMELRRSAQAQLDALETEERDNPVPPAGAQRVNGGVRVGTYRPAEVRDDEPVLASIEYRKAFREYVLNGTPIETRNG